MLLLEGVIPHALELVGKLGFVVLEAREDLGVEDLEKIPVREIEDILVGDVFEVEPLSVAVGDHLGLVGDVGREELIELEPEVRFYP